jgi:cytochrome o ubiquinol oxidase operon protein cyoD
MINWNTSTKPVITGFVLSLLCTFVAYFLVVEKLLASSALLVAVASLGLLQTAVQIFCFFHIAAKEKPRWNLMMFLFMILVVFLVIGGSLWIMDNLNRYVMPTE